MKRRVTIIGHFSFKKEVLNGQTIKTKTIAEALEKAIGQQNILLEDTHGKWKFLLRSPLIVWRSLFRSRNVIFMPAYKGVRVIVPLLVTMNLFFRRKLHYVVVGGWLPSYAKRLFLLRLFLQRIDYIYVETHTMKKKLEELHFNNVCVMPNCKRLSILKPSQLPSYTRPPYHLCIFSRIIPEKGIEDAIKAVRQCNAQSGQTIYTLDLYGPVEQPEWFKELMSGQPDEITYKGTVPFHESTQVLRHYFALIFPTYYRGEAFAGTLIDALAAGLPVIATDWHSNPEIVVQNKTGILYPARSAEALAEILLDAASHPEHINAMRSACIQRASYYLPDNIIQPLVKNSE